MAIQEVDTTNLTEYCDECATTNVIALSGLEAGSDRSPEEIILPQCACGWQWTLRRTFPVDLNPSRHAGAVNGLHRYLVDTLAQTNSNWTAQLTAETADDKPAFYYALSATAIEIGRGPNGEFGVDAAQLKLILGEEEAKRRIGLGLVVAEDADAPLGSAVQDLYGAGDAGDQVFAAMKLARVAVFGA